MTDHTYLSYLVILASILGTWEFIWGVLWIVGHKYNKKGVK
jgi:hypothetical protein